MKPLKRFAGFVVPLITGLKPGVNEMSLSRTFEAKPERKSKRKCQHNAETLANLFRFF